MLRKIPGLNHIPNQYRSHRLVGYLDAHHGNFVGDRGNSDAGGAQGQGNIIRQIRELGKLDALLQHKLIPGYGGPVDHIPRSSLHAEAHQSFRQAAGVVSQLRTGLHVVFLLAGLEQSNGGKLIGRLLCRQLFRNLHRHSGSLSRHLSGSLGLLPARRRCFLHWNRNLLHWCRNNFQALHRRFRLQDLIRRFLAVRLMAEKAGEPPFLLRCVLRLVQREVDLRPHGLLPPPGRCFLDGGADRLDFFLLILRTLPVPLGQMLQCWPQCYRQQSRQQ